MSNWTPELELRYDQVVHSLPVDIDAVAREALAELPSQSSQWLLDAATASCATIRRLITPLASSTVKYQQTSDGEITAALGEIFAGTPALRDRLLMIHLIRRKLVEHLLGKRGFQAFEEFRCVEQRFDALAEICLEIGDLSPASEVTTDIDDARDRALDEARYDAVNRMIRGIAHESRNSLQRIDACVEMLLLDIEQESELLPLVQRLQLAATDLKGLYEEIRHYSAPLHLEPRRTRLMQIIDSAWEKTEPQRRPRTVVIRKRLRDPDVELSLDHIRVEEAFQNLFECSLKCSSDPVMIELTGQVDPTDPGRYELVIRDNGTPIEEKQRPRANEPFVVYRSKSPLLGIAFASRVVRAHGGTIDLVADVTDGVAYRLLFPFTGDQSAD